MLPRLFIVIVAFAALLAGAQAAEQLIAMGPDPGGHTGAGVTPDTTRTDRPDVDSARKAASGSKVETNRDKGAQSTQSGKRLN
ncbi:MAG TPA: hypothetical protein VHB46_12520 [Burkholderiales bacterium]|nr:hypothetical protein [Burkholderiales bacterium]